MRRVTRITAGIALFVSPTIAAADEFSDFRIPENRSYSVRGRLQGSFSGIRMGQSFGPTRKGGSSQGALDGSGFWQRESERGVLSFSGASLVAGFVGQQSERSEYVSSLPYYSLSTDASDSRGTDETLALDALVRRYPFASPVGLEASISGRVTSRQDWRHFNRSDLQEDPMTRLFFNTTQEIEEHARYYSGAFRVAAGYGRVRNATGVYAARILERRLLDLGIIKQPLGKGGAEKLAALFYVERDFSSAHDRPDKYFWRELERILTEDGALAEPGLDAHSVLRVLEPLIPTENAAIPGALGFRRDVGFFVGLGITGQHVNQISKMRQHSHTVVIVDTNPPIEYETMDSQRNDNGDDIVFAGPRAEFHRPIGMRWQVDAATDLGVAFETDRVKEALQWSTNASAIYAISDRWFASLEAAHFRDYRQPPADKVISGMDTWQVLYGGGVGYFLEDGLVLNLTVIERQTRYQFTFPFSSGYRIYARDTRAQLDVTYRFLGGLDAPGLMSPVRRNVGGR